MAADPVVVPKFSFCRKFPTSPIPKPVVKIIRLSREYFEKLICREYNFWDCWCATLPLVDQVGKFTLKSEGNNKKCEGNVKKI